MNANAPAASGTATCDQCNIGYCPSFALLPVGGRGNVILTASGLLK